ncbi:MAG: hypothetical protein DHS20C01_26250 [marine bacterium B5-7]|nr:MAG: hypothetical protein DHS20C01_26250 [marine bacterium B5-7]
MRRKRRTHSPEFKAKVALAAIRSDLIGLLGGINTYGYALQNPGRHIDPLGLYIPTNWPDNCLLIIVDDDSLERLRHITGDPYVYSRDILFTGIPISRRKGDTLKIGFVARLF